MKYKKIKDKIWSYWFEGKKYFRIKIPILCNLYHRRQKYIINSIQLIWIIIILNKK